MTRPDDSAPAAKGVPAVILAGGLSRRMGEDKAGLPFGEQTLLQKAIARLATQGARVAVNSNRPLERLAADIDVFTDTVEGHRGPLAGILAAMRHAASLPDSPPHVATVAVDSPFFPRDFLERLASALSDTADIAIAASQGRSHPVFGLWPVRLADDLQQWLGGGDLSVRGFLARHPHIEVDFPVLDLDGERLDPFFNINTPEDLERALKIEARFHP